MEVNYVGDLNNKPVTFVGSRGHLGRTTTRIMLDLRKVMGPYTASHLKMRKQDKIKDMILAGRTFGVTHVLLVSRKRDLASLRILKSPQGPSATFKIENYSLMRDVKKATKQRPVQFDKHFQSQSFLVMNNISKNRAGDRHVVSFFQGMFPSVDVSYARLSKIKRVVLLDKRNDGLYEFRHYGIKIGPVGVSKGIKSLFKDRVPNMKAFRDISDFVSDDGKAIGNENEDEGVAVAQDTAAPGVAKSSKASVKLFEIGPRITLRLVKVCRGLSGGEVLFHSSKTKTKEEKKTLKKRHAEKLLAKLERKKRQEENVKKREEKLESSSKSRRKPPPSERNDDSDPSGLKTRKTSVVGKAKQKVTVKKGQKTQRATLPLRVSKSIVKRKMQGKGSPALKQRK